MRNNNALGQKFKGKVQKLKGGFQQATGHEIKGAINKMRGSANDAIADIKLNNRRRSRTRGII